MPKTKPEEEYDIIIHSENDAEFVLSAMFDAVTCESGATDRLASSLGGRKEALVRIDEFLPEILDRKRELAPEEQDGIRRIFEEACSVELEKMGGSKTTCGKGFHMRSEDWKKAMGSDIGRLMLFETARLVLFTP